MFNFYLNFFLIKQNKNSLYLAAKPKLREFNRFAKTELYPPTPADIPAIIKGFSNLVSGTMSMRWTRLPVKEAWLNTLIGIEVMCWFFVGEVIGKRNLIGYNV